MGFFLVGGGGGLERKWKREADNEDNEGRETQIGKKQYSSRTFCLTWNKHTLLRGRKPV